MVLLLVANVSMVTRMGFHSFYCSKWHPVDALALDYDKFGNCAKGYWLLHASSSTIASEIVFAVFEVVGMELELFGTVVVVVEGKLLGK